MSKENFEKAMKFVFEMEGGYSNRKDDRGGKTNMGVTQKNYDAYRTTKKLPLQDVRNITQQEAKNRKSY